MAISVSSKNYSVFGNRAVVVADIAFDSSYPYGGEACDHDQLLGLHDLDIVLFEPKGGYSFEFDYTNKKIKAFVQAPPIVYEEHQTIDSTAGTITLNYPAAFIINVAALGQNLKMRSTGVTPAANQCALSSQMAAGERTVLKCSADADDLAGAGAFTGAATGWTLAAGWAYSSNTVLKNGDGVGTLSHDSFACVIGRKYKLTYTISAWSVGTVTPSMGGVTGTAVGADGTYTEYFTATAVTGLAFTPTNTARFTIDTVTIACQEVFVTYVTQAWRDVWDNLVQDESVTLASGANTLTSGNKIACCMYIDQTTATAAALTMIDEDDTVESGEVDLKLNSATAQFTVHADQNAKVAKTTYIKVPASGFLADRIFTNESATKAGSDPYTNTFDNPILLWGYTGSVPINGGATLAIIDNASTPATGEAVIDWYNPGTRGAAAPATGTVVGVKDNVTATAAGIRGVISEIQNLQPLEVKDGSNLAGLTSVRMILIGT